MTPSEVGAIAEREVAWALLRAGWSVFTPLFAAHGRVDLLAIDPFEMTVRLQVKTSRLMRDGTVLGFRTCSNTANNPLEYGSQIDAFGVWSPDLRRAYVVPVDDTPTRFCHLRLSPPTNRQGRGIRFASDFEVPHSG